MKKFIAILVALVTALIIGASIEKQYLINHIKVVDIGCNWVDINWGHEELDDGHFSDDNIHRYEFNIN